MHKYTSIDFVSKHFLLRFYTFDTHSSQMFTLYTEISIHILCYSYTLCTIRLYIATGSLFNDIYVTNVYVKIS